MLTKLLPAACVACLLPAAAPLPVDVELAIAVDVSRSMDEEEFRLQRAGYVEALRHPDFARAAMSGVNRRIAVAYFEWAGTVRTESTVDWAIIDGPQSAAAFAQALESKPFVGFRGTSISGALDHGGAMIDANAIDGRRKVVDVSGDGPNNAGGPVTVARDALVARGIVVNGLPIVIRPSPTVPDLQQYYADCVIGGPGAFMLPIRAAEEFSVAIRRKLILEVSGASQAGVTRAAASAPADCLKGERDRQRYGDPFFPELDREPVSKP